MEKKNPFEMTSVKPIDTELLPYGSWVLMDLSGIPDDDLVNIVTTAMRKLLAQMRGAQKEYGITPEPDSIQFVVKVNPEWPSFNPKEMFETKGTIAIRYYARRVPNDEVLSEKKNTGTGAKTGGRDSER